MKKRQQGIALIAAAALLAAAMAMLVFGINADIKRMIMQSADSDRVKVAQAADEIRDWYERNAWVIEQTADIPDLSGINPYNTAGVTVAASKQLEKNGIKYHVLAAWVPKSGVTGTGLNAETGVFAEGTTATGAAAKLNYALVSGYEIQSAKMRATRENMQRIASSLENWASARQQYDADGKSDTNWLRRAVCEKDDGAIPCYDAPTKIEDTAIGTLAGVSSLDFISGWAQPIYAENVQAASGPYRISLVTATPWGVDFVVEALQQ